MTRSLLASLCLLGFAALAPGQAPLKPASTPDVDKALETFKTGKFDEAFDQLKKACAANPQLQPPRIILAGWFVQAERGKDARATLERFTAEEPRHPDGYLLNASFAFGEGRITDAILSCQAALQFSADARWDAEVRKRYVRESRLGLAASFEQRGDWASVKEQLTGLLNDDPKNGPLRQRLGAATFQTGKPEEAFADFQKASQDDPAVDPPELRLAALWAAKAERDKSEDWLKKAVAAHAANPKTHRAYAGYLLDEGKPDAAQLYIHAATKLDSKARDTATLQALLSPTMWTRRGGRSSLSSGYQIGGRPMNDPHPTHIEPSTPPTAPTKPSVTLDLDKLVNYIEVDLWSVHRFTPLSTSDFKNPAM